MPPVVDESLKIRAQSSGLGRQFPQLRPDFFFRWQKFHGDSYTIDAVHGLTA
jgi:hypothetical protein